MNSNDSKTMNTPIDRAHEALLRLEEALRIARSCATLIDTSCACERSLTKPTRNLSNDLSKATAKHVASLLRTAANLRNRINRNTVAYHRRMQKKAKQPSKAQKPQPTPSAPNCATAPSDSPPTPPQKPPAQTPT
jgi:hypothetical protein